MKVLDLFSGLGGWSAAFKDRGHNVLTVDIEPKFNPDYCMNIMDVEYHTWFASAKSTAQVADAYPLPTDHRTITKREE